MSLSHAVFPRSTHAAYGHTHTTTIAKGEMYCVAFRLKIYDFLPLEECIRTELMSDVVPERTSRRSTLNKINANKAPGPDGISDWILLDFVNLFQQLRAVFNVSTQERTFPKCWKISNVISITKIKSPLRLDTYIRPVSLTRTVGRQLEQIIGGWLLLIIKDNLD